MENKTFYNEILTDHNLHPFHKYELVNPTVRLEGVNPSCGDDIWLSLKVNDGVIEDGSFVGDGCAISQASADIMLELVKGKTVDEAKAFSDKFLRMIKGEASEDEIESLEEASALQDISFMPARVKCAVLGWRTLNEAIEKL
jgi:nitrogen fixation NifU-like protein